MPLLTDPIAAVELLRSGAVVALPTETVYGLGGHALNPLSIRQIYATKGRPAGHPVIVHLSLLILVPQVVSILVKSRPWLRLVKPPGRTTLQELSLPPGARSFPTQDSSDLDKLEPR